MMMVIPPALIKLGLENLRRTKKGLESGFNIMRKGMRKGLSEIETGVKKGLRDTKAELKKEGKRVAAREKEKTQARKKREEMEVLEDSEDETRVMAPIILKGSVPYYTPFSHLDIEGMKARLPPLCEGAGAFIAKFEDEENTGKTLGVGDIKYLLSKILGKAEAESLLHPVGLDHIMADPSLDAEPFNDYRHRIWRALRQAYPNQFVSGVACVGTLKDTESPGEFLEQAARLWRAKMEQDPDESNAVRSQFRQAVLEGVPTLIKTKLEDHFKWRLTEAPFSEFRSALIYTVTAYRKEQEDKKKRSEEAQQKLIHMQLQEATKLAKKPTVQAPVIPAPTNPQSDSQNQMSSVQQQAQIVQQVLQNIGYNPQRPGGFGGQGGPRGGGPPFPAQRRNVANHSQPRQQQKTYACWNCNSVLHLRRDCPHMPQDGSGQQGQRGNYRPQQHGGGPGGPVSPYGGPPQ